MFGPLEHLFIPPRGAGGLEVGNHHRVIGELDDIGSSRDPEPRGERDIERLLDSQDGPRTRVLQPPLEHPLCLSRRGLPGVPFRPLDWRRAVRLVERSAEHGHQAVDGGHVAYHPIHQGCFHRRVQRGT